ncbi:hypothetical protein PYW08_013496 [Mythimna loreyi]|uniref:Uncharacterized protein n=1 Tax=Mythimna loreyi TaxID=667449 RepID=A0ACC2QFV0_9NEOP|nr:hypothetical protein PYW08_013496 [Mythimna loreyi]
MPFNSVCRLGCTVHMKTLAVTVLILAAATSAMAIDLVNITGFENINITGFENINVTGFENINITGYLREVGVPLAAKLRKIEEDTDHNPNRIVGGEYSYIEFFPYQVGLIPTTVYGDSVCGGSLLNTQRVLTAAHCWFDGQTQSASFKVVLGSTRLYGNDGVRMETKDVTSHPSFVPPVTNDIAMIKLPYEVEYSSSITPIALPTGSELKDTFVGWYGMASGFGYKRDGESTATEKFLRYVYLPIIPFNQCYPFQNIDPSIYICASGAGGKSTCLGDSGGPIVVNSNGKIVLIGICSFISNAGCEKGFPAVFTRVSAYMKWIKKLL